MTDGSHHFIMFPVVKYQWDSTYGLGHCDNTVGIFGIFWWNITGFAAALVKAFRRCNNIISIFKEMIRCVFVSCFFRTGHRMTAYKAVCKALAQDLFVDVRFGASYIRDQSSRF